MRLICCCKIRDDIMEQCREIMAVLEKKAHCVCPYGPICNICVWVCVFAQVTYMYRSMFMRVYHAMYVFVEIYSNFVLCWR